MLVLALALGRGGVGVETACMASACIVGASDLDAGRGGVGGGDGVLRRDDGQRTHRLVALGPQCGRQGRARQTQGRPRAQGRGASPSPYCWTGWCGSFIRSNTSVRCATLVPGGNGGHATAVVGERVPRTHQTVAVVAAAAVASRGLHGRHGIACCPDRVESAGRAAGTATCGRHPEVTGACDRHGGTRACAE